MARKFNPPAKLAPAGVDHVEVGNADTHLINYRVDLGRSIICGCFFCLAMYAPSEIKEWCDELGGELVTAICPLCGIDSAIGSASGYPIEPWFLEKMEARWFGMREWRSRQE